jgi:tRNA G18 (ribose-2'-O)-methylase SpoU
MAKNTVYYGRNPLIEALKAKISIKRVFTKSQSDQRFVEDIFDKLGVQMPIEKRLPSLISQEPHQGVAFESDHQFYLERLESFDFSKFPRVLLCNHLHDIHNLGALSRSAAAFGFGLVVHESRRSFSLNAAAVKVSMGMAFRLKYLEVSNLRPLMESLKKGGYEFAGLNAKASLDLYDWKPNASIGLILGSEAEGIARPILKALDFELSIPMVQGIDSLNVTQAASIAMGWIYSNSLKS